ncbi:MAG TPA: hypothetical protein VNZ52_02605 [Candidatus Thermoplasmatota archaeon]|nr:hypothetical protein [Candidatus Thermoplasmatota archaeon]
MTTTEGSQSTRSRAVLLALLLLLAGGTALAAMTAAQLPPPGESPLGPQPWRAWTLSHVENSVQVRVALAVDPAGTSHFLVGRYCCYRGNVDPYATAFDLVHAEPGPAGYTFTVVDTNAEVGDLVSDSAGRLHAAYESGGASADLRYARRDLNGTWTIEVVEVTPQGKASVWNPNIAVAADGTVHIGYSQTAQGFKHAWRTPQGVWTTEVVETGGQFTGSDNGIDVDAQGRPHVAWRPHSPEHGYSIRYAVKDPVAGWLKERASPSCMSDMDVAVDAQGNPHLTCHGGDGLLYVRRGATPGSWTQEVVSRGPYVGRGTSVAVDPTGKVHATWYNFREPDVMGGLLQGYVHYGLRDPATGQWTLEPVDATLGWSGLDTKLVLDGHRVPRVAYIKQGSQPLPFCPFGYLCYDFRYAEPTLGLLVRGVGMP